MQGKKTHEQQVRIFEHKPDLPDARRVAAGLERDPAAPPRLDNQEARDSEFAVSRGGMHQEDRRHNKPKLEPEAGPPRASKRKD